MLAEADQRLARARVRSEAAQVDSLRRGLEILQLFTPETPEITSVEAGKRLGCSQSTAYRLLQTLVAAGFVRQDPVTKRYSLSLTVVGLASTVLDSMRIRLEAIPEMERLSAVCDARANLAVLDRDAGIVIARVESPSMPRVYFQLGRRVPLHASGLGKVLLAHLPEEEQEAVLRRLDLPRLTDRTITDRDALRAHLRQVRQQGFAVDQGEFIEDVRAVAVPIRDRTGRVVASLSVSGPVPHLTLERLEHLKDEIVRTAHVISHKLGYLG